MCHSFFFRNYLPLPDSDELVYMQRVTVNINVEYNGSIKKPMSFGYVLHNETKLDCLQIFYSSKRETLILKPH